MTCIVGIVDKTLKTTYIGGDSLGSTNSFKVVRKDRKVFKPKKLNNVCVGFTSSFRMGNILSYNDDLFVKDEILTHENMVKNFIPRLSKAFSEGGYQTKDSDQISGGTFLVAQDDKLYKVDSDYQVAESDDLYDACGCGYIAALSSLYTTSKMNLDPVERIRLALQSATKIVPGVEPPFYIINTENDKVVKFTK